MVATASKSITELYTCGNDVYWGEERPEEGGKVCICTLDANGVIQRVSPEGTDVGNRVHEYLFLFYLPLLFHFYNQM